MYNFLHCFTFTLFVYFCVKSHSFIALIHPIQWTIANPGGADRPAKRQKKMSCVSTGQAGPALCLRRVAHHTCFLSRQRDVMASFSFGACTVQTDFCVLHIFRSLLPGYFEFKYISYLNGYYRSYIDHHVFSWTKKRELWPCYGFI